MERFATTRGAVKSGETTTVTVPLGQGMTPGNTLTFVHNLSYMPAKDDDFSFAIEPASGHYTASGSRSKGEAKVEFDLKSLAMPDYVTAFQELVTLEGRQDRARTRFEVPRGRSGTAVIELLQYDTDGDDDVSFLARAFAAGKVIHVIALSDFGSPKSRIQLRVTYLTWPKRVPVQVKVRRLVSAPSGVEDSIVFSERDGRWLATPTMYYADTTKARYSRLSDRRAWKKALGLNSESGRDLNLEGIATEGIDLAEGIMSGDPIKIADAALDFTGEVLKARLDKRDDDFFLRTRTTEAGQRRVRVSVDTGDGNDGSLGEVTVWRFKFPRMDRVARAPDRTVDGGQRARNPIG
jgi:hypothetical protein